MSEIITVEATVTVFMNVFSDGEVSTETIARSKLLGMNLVRNDQTFREWFRGNLPGDPYVAYVKKVKELKREYAGGE